MLPEPHTKSRAFYLRVYPLPQLHLRRTNYHVYCTRDLLCVTHSKIISNVIFYSLSLVGFTRLYNAMAVNLARSVICNEVFDVSLVAHSFEDWKYPHSKLGVFHCNIISFVIDALYCIRFALSLLQLLIQFFIFIPKERINVSQTSSMNDLY